MALQLPSDARRWLGLAIVVSLYLTMPWLAAQVDRGNSLRLFLTILMAATFAGGLVLMFYPLPDDSPSLLHGQAPSAPPPSLPLWVPVFFTIQAVLVTLALVGAFGATGRRLAFVVFLAGTFWVHWYRRRPGPRKAQAGTPAD